MNRVHLVGDQPAAAGSPRKVLTSREVSAAGGKPTRFLLLKAQTPLFGRLRPGWHPHWTSLLGLLTSPRQSMSLVYSLSLRSPYRKSLGSEAESGYVNGTVESCGAFLRNSAAP